MISGALGAVRWLLRRAVGYDVEALKLIRRDLRRLTTVVEELEKGQQVALELARRGDRTASQIRLTALLNETQRGELGRMTELLDERRIAEHVRHAIATARLLPDPYEHAVVERVLPEPVYDLLLRAIPPVEFFEDLDPIKRNLSFPMEFGPTLSATVWQYVDSVIARQVIRPAVLEKFREPLDRHLTSMFGTDFLERARSMSQASSGGRLMLRRPGYHLGPHRDPKRAMLTCLMYLARPGDSEQYGTQIFRVIGDEEAGFKQTYYPEERGATCELVKVVPFRPNSMLVMLNSRGAHGATIPSDAPADLERYAYQFYIAPRNEELAALIKSLPTPQRRMWRSKEPAEMAR